jgi:hypothetical protein
LNSVKIARGDLKGYYTEIIMPVFFEIKKQEIKTSRRRIPKRSITTTVDK